MSTREVRYGLIGAGYLGKALARDFAALPGGRVTAVYDPHHAAGLANELGAEASRTWEALCAHPEVDVVVIASPNGAHAPQAILAAQHGKAVFCEKPIALSVGDAAAMVAAARDAGTLFMAGHATHFMPGVRRLKAAIADGLLGDLVHVRAVRNTWENEHGGAGWKKDPALSGGHLYHHIHELDLLVSVMGLPSEVDMMGANVAHHGPHSGAEDDLITAVLSFGEAAFGTLEYGSAYRWAEHHVLVQGTQGAAWIDLQGRGCTLRTADGREERFLLHANEEQEADRRAFYDVGDRDARELFGTPDRDVPLWLGGLLQEETAYFHALAQGAQPSAEFASLTDGSAALASLATADAMSASLRERRRTQPAQFLERAHQGVFSA